MSYEIEERDVEYRRDAEGTSWMARVYRPKGGGVFPAILDVHGGVWSGGDRAQDAYPNRALAASGMVVAAIDFRLAPAHRYPASIEDVNYGVRWLKATAGELGARAERVGIFGSSSGGHMAVLSAMRPRDPRYTALAGPADVDASVAYAIACWPVLDPHARYLYAREVGRAELVERTEGYFGDIEAMQEASPTLILRRGEACELPPTLIVAGAADANVPTAIVHDFVEAYRARGGEAELAVFEGAVHGFGNRPGPEADRAIAAMREFVARWR